MRKQWFWVVLLVLVCWGAAVGLSADPGIIVGVLEHYQYKQQVRVAFKKEGKEWKAFPHDVKNDKQLDAATAALPEEEDWAVCYRSTQLGAIYSKLPSAVNSYSDVGTHLLKMGDDIPVVGDMGNTYSGSTVWKSYRPLIVNTKPYFKDPDQWQYVAPSPKMIKLCLPKFMAAIKNIQLADDKGKRYRAKVKDQDVGIYECYHSRDN